MNQYVRWFENLSNEDVSQVGGKNASLGEMIQKLGEKGVRIPGGFATTALAYREFIDHNNIEVKIRSLITDFQEERKTLQESGKHIRRLFEEGEFPDEVKESIFNAYDDLSIRYESEEVDVAARSSATAEDLPEASFAGQQETFLNITGHRELLEACKGCYASLFTDRAISYREEQGFDHMEVALSVGVQKMVRSDKASSGVMFTIDTETGFPDAVVINAGWGLGDNIVQGVINPDEYRVFKPLLSNKGMKPIIQKQMGEKEQKLVYASGRSETTKNVETSTRERRSYVLEDEEILLLGRWAVAIEEHYERPMDIEWAKDGLSGDLFVVQARPETVQSQRDLQSLKNYRLKESGDLLVEGLSIGSAIATGKAELIDSPEEQGRFQEGGILVTGMTDPDWVPIMKLAQGIITDHGGRTSHAAIVSRELGIPAVVGTGNATQVLQEDQLITLSCAEGDTGKVYKGKLDFDTETIDLGQVPKIQTQIMMNISSPASAFRWWQLPCEGIGLARMEFVVNNIIKVHPLALVHFDRIEDKQVREQIERLTYGYQDKTEYFVDRLALGLAQIAASRYPEDVIVRMSDFKTNEYANLIGGEQFEPEEANPMLGFRGASRYQSDRYREGFALECRAIKKAREVIGFKNIIVMIPFCRTPEEADGVLDVMGDYDLERGVADLQVYMMAEIPSNIVLASDFASRFDGFSIGSNDLTQLVLGVDRDSDLLSDLFDERSPAVKGMIRTLIDEAHEAGLKVGICGQAPSDYPEFARFLVEAGIDSISLNPDSVIEVIERLAELEKSGA